MSKATYIYIFEDGTLAKSSLGPDEAVPDATNNYHEL